MKATYPRIGTIDDPVTFVKKVRTLWVREARSWEMKAQVEASSRKVPPRWELDLDEDVMQSCVAAIVSAASQYRQDHPARASFETYARKAVFHALTDSLKEQYAPLRQSAAELGHEDALAERRGAMDVYSDPVSLGAEAFVRTVLQSYSGIDDVLLRSLYGLGVPERTQKQCADVFKVGETYIRKLRQHFEQSMRNLGDPRPSGNLWRAHCASCGTHTAEPVDYCDDCLTDWAGLDDNDEQDAA